MELILLLFLITATYLLTKQYPCDASKRKKQKHYLLLVFTVWLILLTLYLVHCSPSMTDTIGIRLELLFFALFILYNVFFMIYIRKLFSNSYWYLLLLLPVTYFFFFNLLLFNEPSYNGAMDGFAAIITFYKMLQIFITYPVFVFAFSMTRCHPKIKAIGLFLFIIVTGVLGIQQPIGYEGYLADDTGNIFVAMLLLLATITIRPFFSTTIQNPGNQ
jgi:drug/metabolite transporter (DMT)-like permease